MSYKITFFSNFMNHHQLPFSLEMINQNVDYIFVATEPISKERLDMGYEDMNKKYSFVLTTYDNAENKKKALNLSIISDIVIIGSAPEIYIRERMKRNMLTFRYSERIFKKGRYRILNPRTLFYLINNHTRYRNRKLFMLCASAFTAGDFAMAGAYINKCYKWGYFPEKKMYDIDQLIEKKNKNEVIKILWCARFIKFKHPESMIELSKRLLKSNYKFEINMIGNGVLFDVIKENIKNNGLNEHINLLGSIDANLVRGYMEESNIFVFSSDHEEGWGAVLNESMNAACAVVASNEIGSVPFLIKNNENGIIYKNGNNQSLYAKVKYLIDNENERNIMARKAYSTIISEWNAETAVKNLLVLYNGLNNGEKVKTREGVCSVAKRI